MSNISRQFGLGRFFGVLLVLCAAAPGCDARQEYTYNVALGKPCRITPAPNYRLCTDADDVKQLTDGKKTGAIWTKKSTVGWQKPRDIIQIDIDLMGLFQIDTVLAYTTTGGHPDVRSPRDMAVMVSQNGDEYVLSQVVAGAESIVQTSVPKSRKQPVVLKATHLGVRARYLRLLLRPNVRYAFLDEIEVLGYEVAGRKSVSKRTISSHEHDLSLLRSIEEIIELKESLQNLKKRTDAQTGKTSSQARAVQSKIDFLESEINTFRDVNVKQHIQQIRDRVGLLRAELYREQSQGPLLCLSANPMSVLKRSDMPSGDLCTALQFSMWRGEYESSTVNLVNTSAEPLQITAKLASLMDEAGRSYDVQQTFVLRKAVYTFVNTLGFIGDALIRQGGRPFSIQPGQIEQVWITAFNPTLAAGTYTGALVVTARNGDGKIIFERSIPLNIHVWPLRMPPNPSGEFFNWAYYRSGTKEATAADLQLHRTTIAFLNSAEAALPPQNSGVFQPPNKASLDKMDQVISRHPYARQYVLFLNFRKEQKDWGRFGKWMTPQWKRTFASWLKSIVRHMREQGLGYDRWLLQPFDETLCNEFYDLALLIKQIDPQVRIFADHINDKPATIRRFRSLIDVWCPNERHIRMYPDRLRLVQSFGKPVWMYKSQGPGRANDPYSYYRLAHWRAFQYGLEGVGFWVYHDKNGPVVWDEIGNVQGYYGVIYSGSSYPGGSLDESIVPSRRWQAWREGAEDFEYLRRFDNVFKEQHNEDLSKRGTVGKDIQREIREVSQNPDVSGKIYDLKQKISRYLVDHGVN